LVVSLFLNIAAIRYDAQFHGHHEDFIIVVVLISAAFFVLSLFLVPLMCWRAVRICSMDKMDGWWWFSTPYSVAFLLSVWVFRLDVGHTLAPYFVLWMMAFASSAMWTLARTYQLAVSRTAKFSTREAVMLAPVVLLGAFWLLSWLLSLRATTGR